MKIDMKFKLKVIDKMVAEKEAILEDYSTNQLNKLNQTKKDDIDNTQYDSQSSEALSEMEMLNKNVEILEKEVFQLRDIPVDLHMDTVRLGSLVETDRITLLVCVPQKDLDVGGVSVKGISMSAPIYKKMKGLKKGDHFEEIGVRYVIRSLV